MEKKQLERKMSEAAGNAAFITRAQLADLMGYKDAHYIDKYLVNVGKIGRGKYFIPDVAGNIMRMQN